MDEQRQSQQRECPQGLNGLQPHRGTATALATAVVVRTSRLMSAPVTASTRNHACPRRVHGLVAAVTVQRCETFPMRKLPTGEPYAGKPPVRFGGRGERKLFPTPIRGICFALPDENKNLWMLAVLADRKHDEEESP